MPAPEDRFKTNFLTLIEICKEMVEEGNEENLTTITPTMFSIFKIFTSKMSGEFLIKKFINKTSDYWDKILEKDLEYFKSLGLSIFTLINDKGLDSVTQEEDKTLTKNLSASHISSFKELLSATYKGEDGEEIAIFDDDRIEDVWNIMHSFVKMSISYIHIQRKPNDQDEYTEEFYPNIKIKENAEKWKIKKFS